MMHAWSFSRCSRPRTIHRSPSRVEMWWHQAEAVLQREAVTLSAPIRMTHSKFRTFPALQAKSGIKMTELSITMP
jgi:hypothetical protein